MMKILLRDILNYSSLYVHRMFFLISLAIGGSFLSFLPFIMGLNLGYDDISENPFGDVTSTDSIQFRYALVSCISISSVLALDLLLSSSTFEDISNLQFLRRLLLISSILIPSVAIFTNLSSIKVNEIIFCILHVRKVLTICSYVAFFSDYKLPAVSNISLHASALLFSTSAVLETFSGFYPIHRYSINQCQIASLFAAFLLFLGTAITFFLRSRSSKLSCITFHHRVLYVVVIVVCVANFAMTTRYGGVFARSTSIAYATFITYALTPGVVLMYVLDNRLCRIRKKALQVKPTVARSLIKSNLSPALL